MVVLRPRHSDVKSDEVDITRASGKSLEHNGYHHAMIHAFRVAACVAVTYGTHPVPQRTRLFCVIYDVIVGGGLSFFPGLLHGSDHSSRVDSSQGEQTLIHEI